MLIFHSFKASGSKCSRLHHRLLKSFKEAAISLRHLEKSILEGNLYLGPLEMILRTLASGMTFRHSSQLQLHLCMFPKKVRVLLYIHMVSHQWQFNVTTPSRHFLKHVSKLVLMVVVYSHCLFVFKFSLLCLR